MSTFQRYYYSFIVILASSSVFFAFLLLFTLSFFFNFLSPSILPILPFLLVIPLAGYQLASLCDCPLHSFESYSVHLYSHVHSLLLLYPVFFSVSSHDIQSMRYYYA